jgi:hypothetical protein
MKSKRLQRKKGGGLSGETEKQEGSIRYLFGIISKAEPAEGWHHGPWPNIVRLSVQRAK